MPKHHYRSVIYLTKLGHNLVLVAILLISIGCTKDAGQKSSNDQPSIYVSSPYLLSVADVVALLKTSSPPLLIETSRAERFAQGHLPGAINLWRPDYTDYDNYPYGGMRAKRKKMAQLMGELGAENDKLIIVYCTKGSVDASRLQWILRGYGHDLVAIMDGGKAAWQHAGYPLVKDINASRVSTDYHFRGPEQESYNISLQEVLAATTDTNFVIVDAREDYEYFGTPHHLDNQVVRYKAGAFAQGAIPGARHLNWSESVDLHSDHTFKPLADLRYNFHRQGITPDKEIIVYCHSGVRSAHTTFVLSQLLGYPNVKNYDGSWIEWSYTHAADPLGKLQLHTSPEETEMIYRNLMGALKNKNNE